MIDRGQQISSLKEELAASFNPTTLEHRRLVKDLMTAQLEKGVTAADVQQEFPECKSDTEATWLFLSAGIAEILAVETGAWDDDAFETIWQVAAAIHTPEMKPAALVDLVLERMPGSVTYKQLH